MCGAVTGVGFSSRADSGGALDLPVSTPVIEFTLYREFSPLCYHFITPVRSSWLQPHIWNTGGLPHTQMPRWDRSGQGVQTCDYVWTTHLSTSPSVTRCEHLRRFAALFGHGARNSHPPTSSVPTPCECERHRREMVTHGNGQCAPLPQHPLVVHP